MLLLDDKILYRQIVYYKYIIKCIDLYLTENDRTLIDFLNKLIFLNKTQVVLGDDFENLFNVVKSNDCIMLLYFKYKFSCFIQKNELKCIKQSENI